MPISGEVQGNKEYWAAKPDDEFASDLKDAIIRYYRQMDATGRTDVWRRSVRTYYGLDAEGSWRNSSAITYGGEQGELVMLRVNHYRNLIQHMLSGCTHVIYPTAACSVQSCFLIKLEQQKAT